MPEHDLTAVKVPVSELAQYHRNARQGDVEAIKESLDELGQVQPYVVNRGTLTGRPNEVLGGNHNVQAHELRGTAEVWVSYVDVDDVTAAKIVSQLNKTGDKAGYDKRLLAELLGYIEEAQGSLDGSGWENHELDDLLDELDPSEGERPTLGDPVIAYQIVFDDEAQQDTWFDYQRWLREQYPDAVTQAERLAIHLADVMKEPA